MTSIRIALTLVSLLAVAPVVAKGHKPDCSRAVASVEALMATACPCDQFATHGAFVKCAVHVVKDMAGNGTIARNCRGGMVRGFARSTCGKTDAVTCCVARHGGTACVVKKTAVCATLGGSVGSTPFCADACVPASPSGAFVE
jgi:hypothetical protein